jgi:hypothetical protein
MTNFPFSISASTSKITLPYFRARNFCGIICRNKILTITAKGEAPQAPIPLLLQPNQPPNKIRKENRAESDFPFCLLLIYILLRAIRPLKSEDSPEKN